MAQSLTEVSTRVASFEATPKFSSHLVHSLFQRLPPSGKRGAVVVTFTSVQPEEGASAIVDALAAMISKGKNRRVLVVDGARPNAGAASLIGMALPPASNALTQSNREGGLTRATMPSTGEAVEVEALSRTIDGMDGSFQYIFIVASRSVAVTTASVVDGSIIVVEAENTRWQTVRHLAEQIADNGGQLIGTILNNRRNYIPDRLYRRFFNH